jgi:phage antirepressor YoqD-like protein
LWTATSRPTAPWVPRGLQAAGANEHEFSEFLARAKIMYRLAKMTPHAEHMEAGRFVVKRRRGHAQ